ncbi:M14 family metallopeptidase [Limobrevibacterium gyesilva]|uniref:Succinylglutamate desuccinylase/aspartoacylase family protein n=1 Tax=Limobrevibacterium gyesilva TaxID=2991712 RepID=A0AA41YJI7_9PROT|nr:succinylglutamate desuccinylase/aspartoacylase family protein [Limobrevibacterium gyesilva]MCW3473227.1 succinylglutamate desuccinylase/aspartoacylase family protein [Limobrevibacterium gyesilva]
MTREIVRPAGLDLESPGRRDYYVALEHDSIWGDHLIPLTVFVGPRARPGQGLVAFGANHGNEYEGPVAIRHLLREIDIADVTGRIILVPVLNVAAFRAGTRDSTLDDRVNLNRAFIDGAGHRAALAGITHRIADFVRAHLWPQVHVVIDLHAGGQVARFALGTSFHRIDHPDQGRLIEETARWFGTPLVITYQNETPGLLPSEAERLGKIAIGGEFGWGGAIQPEGVRYARHGVLAAAIHHGQLRGQVDKIAYHADGTQRLVDMADRDCLTIAPFAGHYEPLLHCGTDVAKGEQVGWLHDFERLDLDPWPVRAGVDGIVVAQAWAAPVLQGQHILCTGRVKGRKPF